MFWWPAWQKLFWKSLSLGGDLICTEWLGAIPSVSRERGGSCQSVSGHTPPPLWHQPIFMQCLRVVHQILLVYSTHIWATVLKPLVTLISNNITAANIYHSNPIQPNPVHFSTTVLHSSLTGFSYCYMNGKTCYTLTCLTCIAISHRRQITTWKTLQVKC